MIADLDAEHSALGCAMYAPQDCADAFERLKPEHFAEPLHARIWAAILQNVRSSKIPDVLTIRDALGTDKDFAEVGGLQFLLDLTDQPRLWALPAHADAIIDRAGRRAIQMLAKQIDGQATNIAEGSADLILADLERGASEIARDGAQRPVAVPVGLGALETLEGAWRGDFQGVPTGLDCLDHVTGGIKSDDVWFIGGRTSMGKSVMGLQLARNIAGRNRGVMVFSLEMALREVQARLVADLAYDRDRFYDEGNVRYGDLLKGRGDQSHKARAREAARHLASLPLSVNDRGGLTIDDIRIQAQRQLRAWEKAGVERGAILIDHIGLVKPARKTDSKAADTADTVNELKDLAKQLKAPIIALVQVNRQTENRTDKRPQLSDLNWSGSIEQIADFICLLYREAYYEERADKTPKAQFDLELLVHKNRAGPICTLHAHCDVRSNAVRDESDIDRSNRGAQ